MKNGETYSKTLIEELDKRGKISFVPKGDSMVPTIKNKSQSVIVVKKQGRLKLYDVGLFYRPSGNVVLHRVVKVVDGGYFFCGDSQFYVEKVEEDNVIGVMTGYYRGKKFINATDESERKKAERWFSSEKKRKRKLKPYFFFRKLKYRIKKLFKIIFGKNK